MKTKIEIFITFVLLIVATNASATNISFNALTLTEVDAAPYLKSGDSITCQISNIERNITYELANQGFEEIFYTTSGKSQNFSITDDCWKFSIFQYDNASFYWSKFRILDAYNNSSYYFILAQDGVQIYRINSTTEQIEWQKYIELENLLPSLTETKFSIRYDQNDFIFDSEILGNIIILPITRTSYAKIMLIEGSHAAPARWKLNDCYNSTKAFNFDKFVTFCSNSTNNETESNNQTSTYFIKLIETQYRIQKVMENDLKDFLYWDNSKMIKEFIEEFLSDVKENYSNSLQTHRLIQRYYKLNKYEISLKEKYLREYVFERTRRSYFELYKNAQLILSRFR